MAVKTIYEIFDITHNDNILDLSITATDKEGISHEVISNADAKRYLVQKYATREYPVILGVSASILDAKQSWQETYSLYLKNHKHGIDKQYQALFDYNYSPIENVDRFETETTEGTESGESSNTTTNNLTNTTRYGKVETNSGSDTTTYGREVTESGNDVVTNDGSDTLTNGGTDTVTNSGSDALRKTGTDTLGKSGSIINTTEKAGFNSPNSYTPDTKNTESYNNYAETETLNTTDTTTFGHIEATQHGHTETTAYGQETTTDYGHVETNSGEDTIEFGHVLSNSGADTNTQTGTVTDAGETSGSTSTERTLHTHGNIGVTTNNQLIESEIAMRKLSLAEMIIDDIINEYTYYC